MKMGYKCIEEVTEILDLLYKHGWDERNGGNLSYILTEEEVESVCDTDKVKRTFTYNFDMSSIVGKYFVITGTGKYFKNYSNITTRRKVSDRNRLLLNITNFELCEDNSELITELKSRDEYR